MGVVKKIKAGFTLAEVLITLGIIGIVAALTLPSLIAKYQRTVTVNKVKKFYTVMSQATNIAIAENGPMYSWDGFEHHHNGEEMKHWFDKYLKPHLNVTDEYIMKDESNNHEKLVVTLADGEVASFTNYSANSPDIDEETGIDNNHSNINFNGLIHVYYKTTPKALEKESKDCVNLFTFLFYSPLKKQYYFQPYAFQINTPEKNNREFIFEQLKSGNNQYCAALMMIDGWQIKDDYPYEYSY